MCTWKIYLHSAADLISTSRSLYTSFALRLSSSIIKTKRFPVVRYTQRRRHPGSVHGKSCRAKFSNFIPAITSLQSRRLPYRRLATHPAYTNNADAYSHTGGVHLGPRERTRGSPLAFPEGRLRWMERHREEIDWDVSPSETDIKTVCAGNEEISVPVSRGEFPVEKRGQSPRCFV